MSFSDVPFNHAAEETFKALIKPSLKSPQPAKETDREDNSPRPNLMALRTRNQYLQAQVETASPTRLIVMLYEGAIRFCHQGVEAMKSGNLEEQSKSILKAQNIVTELLGTLDRERGGAIADNLLRVYRYMLDRLVDANFEDDPNSVYEVIGLLGELKASWEEVDRLTTINNGQAGKTMNPFLSRGE